MRPVLSAERYVLRLLVTTQRWAPPALVLAGTIAWIWVTPPVTIDTVRLVLVALFALAAWLGHATGTSEDPNQELISATCRGSAARLLVAKWSTAGVLAAMFPLAMLAGTAVYDRVGRSGAAPTFTAGQTGAAAVALIAIAAAGAALGIVITSLLPDRPGWSTAVLVVAGLAQAAPWMAPVPWVAASLPGPGGAVTMALGLALAGTAVITAVLLGAATLCRRPSR